MTYSWGTTAVVFALLASAACAGNRESNERGNAGDREPLGGATGDAPVIQPATSVGATNGAASEQAERPASEGSIMAWSRPAASSAVSAPVNELVFQFSLPARLDEVTVTGPEGAMATMVTAAGEVEHYSVPVSGLGSGRYTVDWRATARGTAYNGSFGFEVR